MGQTTVFPRERRRSEGRQPEKMVGIVFRDIFSSTICRNDSGRRRKTLRFGVGPRKGRNGARYPKSVEEYSELCVTIKITMVGVDCEQLIVCTG